jgi:hypothetical protein
LGGDIYLGVSYIIVAVHAERLDLLDHLGLVVAILRGAVDAVGSGAVELAGFLADGLKELRRGGTADSALVCWSGHFVLLRLVVGRWCRRRKAVC